MSKNKHNFNYSTKISELSDGIKKFPEDFCLSYCLEKMKQTQQYLIEKVRADIYREYREAVRKSKKKIVFEFYKDELNNNLWQENRKKIVCEILGRFGTIDIKSTNKKTSKSEFNEFMATDSVSKEDDLPDVIDIIEIEIWKS